MNGGSLWSRLAGLALVVEGCEYDRLHAMLAFEFERITTHVRLVGAGTDGLGEDVSVFREDGTALHETRPSLPLEGKWTLASFCDHLAALELWPEPPAWEGARRFRHWAFESAALDLALRQAGRSLHDVLGLTPEPVRFVNSLGLGKEPSIEPLRRRLARSPGVRFKLDAEATWAPALVEEVAATGAVDTIDFKGQYGFEVEDPMALAALYDHVLAAFPDAYLEDPHDLPEIQQRLGDHLERVSYDAPIRDAGDIGATPLAARVVNVKPSRIGSLRGLFDVYARCARERRPMYGGGMGELGVGRGQIELLAALFHADAPNDVAPSAYNEDDPPGGLPASPLAPRPEATGFRWAAWTWPPRASRTASYDLRRRVAATRWPSRELVADRSQGVQLEVLQALARYWLDEYDFGRVEARLNALPQFVTEIDGVDVHFVHVRSSHDNALPLIMTHGWPGSVIELIDTVGPLTDPTGYGGSGEDAFHLVLPLPGYGFSGEPVEVGWDLGRTARAWAELIRRLGYTRFVAQGGDAGAGVTDAMGRQQPTGLIGIHTNLLVPALGGPMPTNTDEERATAAQIATFQKSGNGYFVEMATRPQTIGYALLDSPVALAAWMIDHDTDAYYKIAGAFVDGRPSGNLSRDNVLDNITLYWLTGTGASAARSYWEAYGPDAPTAGGEPLPPPTIPFAFTTFRGEIWRTPRSWVEASYPNVVHFREVDKGGHFAAWEEPELFSTDIRAAFRSLR